MSYNYFKNNRKYIWQSKKIVVYLLCNKSIRYE
jgi:hypothetical protein